MSAVGTPLYCAPELMMMGRRRPTPYTTWPKLATPPRLSLANRLSQPSATLRCANEIQSPCILILTQKLPVRIQLGSLAPALAPALPHSPDLTRRYDASVDVWSFGCVLACLQWRDGPFRGVSHGDVRRLVLEDDLRPAVRGLGAQ